MSRSRIRFAHPTTRLITGAEAQAKLAQLGFREGIVRDAIEVAAGRGRSVITSFYPRTYAGYSMWAETVGQLAQLGEDAGWGREHCRGVEPVVNHERGRAVIVVAGDGATASEHYEPQVRQDRGDVFQDILSGGLENLLDPAPVGPWEIWFLLHNTHAPGADENPVPAELSRPLGLDSEGYVTNWDTRIVIPQGGSGDGVARRRQPGTGGADTAVTIRRRAS